MVDLLCLVLQCTQGFVYDLILYGMIVFLVKFSFCAFLLLMFAIYLLNKKYDLRDGGNNRQTQHAVDRSINAISDARLLLIVEDHTLAPKADLSQWQLR